MEHHGAHTYLYSTVQYSRRSLTNSGHRPKKKETWCISQADLLGVTRCTGVSTRSTHTLIHIHIQTHPPPRPGSDPYRRGPRRVQNTRRTRLFPFSCRLLLILKRRVDSFPDPFGCYLPFFSIFTSLVPLFAIISILPLTLFWTHLVLSTALPVLFAGLLQRVLSANETNTNTTETN